MALGLILITMLFSFVQHNNLLDIVQIWSCKTKTNQTIAFSPNNQFLVSGGGTYLSCVNLETRKTECTFQSDSMFFRHVKFSPDGKYLAIIMHDLVNNSGRLKVIAFSNYKEIYASIFPSSSLTCLRFLDNPCRIIIGGCKRHNQTDSGFFQIVDIASKRIVNKCDGLTNCVRSLDCSPVGRLIFIGGTYESARGFCESCVYSYIPQTDKLTLLVAGEKSNDLSLTCSPDEKMLVISYDEKMIAIEVATKMIRWTENCPQSKPLIYSQNGNFFITGTISGHLELREKFNENNPFVIQGCSGEIWSLAIANNNQFVSVGLDDMLQIWKISKINKRGIGSKFSQLEFVDKLGSHDARIFYFCMRVLSKSPNLSIKLLEKCLHGFDGPSELELKKHIVSLGNKQFKIREQASKELLDFSHHAMGTLEASIKSIPDFIVRKRILLLLDEINARPMPTPVVRVKRAIELLEFFGTEEAITVLKRIENTSKSALLKTEIRASLSRLLQKRD